MTTKTICRTLRTSPMVAVLIMAQLYLPNAFAAQQEQQNSSSSSSQNNWVVVEDPHPTATNHGIDDMKQLLQQQFSQFFGVMQQQFTNQMTSMQRQLTTQMTTQMQHMQSKLSEIERKMDLMQQQPIRQPNLSQQLSEQDYPSVHNMNEDIENHEEDDIKNDTHEQEQEFLARQDTPPQNIDHEQDHLSVHNMHEDIENHEEDDIKNDTHEQEQEFLAREEDDIKSNAHDQKEEPAASSRDLNVLGLRPELQELFREQLGGLTSLSPLCTAVWGGLTSSVQQILASPNVNLDEVCTSTGATSLHIAAFFADLPATQLLLQAGADKDFNGESVGSPLLAAVMSPFPNAFRVVQALLDVQANTDLSENEGSLTLLHLASVFRWLDLEDDAQLIQVLLQAGFDKDATTDGGETPLHYATGCSQGMLPIASLRATQVLLNAGANKHTTNNQGQLPLHCAAGSYSRADIVQALLGDNNDNKDATDQNEMTPLHYAAGSSSPSAAQTVQALLNAGADKDATDQNEMTPLHYAAGSNSPSAAQAVQALLDAG
ncbi:MAG: ankyrin repeat domain-containing protein, partial [Myxococcota bacterium]